MLRLFIQHDGTRMGCIIREPQRSASGSERLRRRFQDGSETDQLPSAVRGYTPRHHLSLCILPVVRLNCPFAAPPPLFSVTQTLRSHHACMSPRHRIGLCRPPCISHWHHRAYCRWLLPPPCQRTYLVQLADRASAQAGASSSTASHASTHPRRASAQLPNNLV